MLTLYCLFKIKPEEISGFVAFAKHLKDRQKEFKIEMLPFEKRTDLTEDLAASHTEVNPDAACGILCFNDGVLITDINVRADMPAAGLITEKNGGALSYKYLFESFEGITADYFVTVYKRYYGLPLDILKTERLCVREISVDDIDSLYDIYEDAFSVKYIEGLYQNKNDEIEYTKSYIKNMYGFYGYGMWVVTEKISGRLIGRAGLENREIDGKTYLELGYLIEKSYRRKGYATEACMAILDYAKTELGATEVLALIRRENNASLKTAVRLGFKDIGKNFINENGETLMQFIKTL